MLLVLALLFSVGSSLPPCYFTVPKTNVTYDFFPLHATTWSAISLTSGYWYQFWPCSNFAEGPQGTLCTIVQYRVADPIAPITIFDTTLQWSFINSSFVQYTTANGGPPNCAPSNKPRFATLQFSCTTGDDGPLKVVYEPNMQGCPTAPGYVFMLPTRCACGNYSCGMTQESSCAFNRRQTPCVVSSYEVEPETSDGKSILLKQGKKTCGRLFFDSPNLRTLAPRYDSCSNKLTGYRSWDSFESVVKMLETETRIPNVFYWDDEAKHTVLGPASLIYEE